jgi:hypothetical protein
MTEHELSKTLINLMKGIVYKQQQPRLWQSMLNLQNTITDHLIVLGLQLIVDENEGYAYLTQQEETENNKDVPKLIAQRPLSFLVSLLCVLLRKKIAELDTGGNVDKIVITKQSIVSLMQNYLPEQNNQVKVQSQIEATIVKVIKMGFLQKIKNEANHYEIMRIIKAFVDADWLADVDKKLDVYLKNGK